MNAGYVFSQVRALLDDQDGEFASDDYLTPHLQAALDDLQNSALNHANIGRLKYVVTVPSVAAGTTSLASYFAAGQSLEFLEDVIQLREKQSGYADSAYSPMRPVLVPPVPNPVGVLNYVYTFTGSDIILPGTSGVTDIQVYGPFKAAVIVNADSVLPLGAETVLKYGTAASVCYSRGSGAMGERFDAKRQDGQDSMFNNWIMDQQAIITRARPFRQRRTVSATEGYWEY